MMMDTDHMMMDTDHMMMLYWPYDSGILTTWWWWRGAWRSRPGPGRTQSWSSPGAPFARWWCRKRCRTQSHLENATIAAVMPVWKHLLWGTHGKDTFGRHRPLWHRMRTPTKMAHQRSGTQKVESQCSHTMKKKIKAFLCKFANLRVNWATRTYGYRERSSCFLFFGHVLLQAVSSERKNIF